MAILSAVELALLRQGVSQGVVGLTWTKPDINAALQAIEDTWETTVRGLLSTAIDNAGVHVFTNAEKKQLGKFWLRHKFGKGG